MCISMRWKILVGFAAAFTVVFVFIAVWVFQNTTNRAFGHLSSQLHSTAVGGAESLDTQVFADLIATVPAAPDATNPTGLGYPDSPLYQAAAADLYRILQVSNQSLPYTYFRDPDDGQLYFAASSGYLLIRRKACRTASQRATSSIRRATRTWNADSSRPRTSRPPATSSVVGCRPTRQCETPPVP